MPKSRRWSRRGPICTPMRSARIGAWNKSIRHHVIDHAGAYVEGKVHTNGLENFWSLLKRTIKGTYISIDPFHVPAYLAEQVHRFNNRGTNDRGCFLDVLHGIIGK